MKTTKPISTISFNTEQYLLDRLNELVRAKRVSFWCFIKHMPEDDEGGLKEHMHVYIEPSKLCQTDDIRDMFREFDPAMPDKPRGCLKFVSSKFSDWYMYALHDNVYLAKKQQSRKYRYTFEEVVSSNADDLLCMVRTIPPDESSIYARMQIAHEQGMDFGAFIMATGSPVQQINQFRTAWDIVVSKGALRNEHQNHPMEVVDDYFVSRIVPEDELPDFD